MTTIADLPVDVIQHMLEVGELSGKDVLHLCKTDARILDKCLRQQQRIYRTILRIDYGITAYGDRTPEELLQDIQHDMYSDIVTNAISTPAFFRLRAGVRSLLDAKIIVPNYVIEAFAKHLGMSVNKLLLCDYFTGIIAKMSALYMPQNSPIFESLYDLSREKKYYIGDNQINDNIPIIASWYEFRAEGKQMRTQKDVDGSTFVVVVGGIYMTDKENRKVRERC